MTKGSVGIVDGMKTYAKSLRKMESLPSLLIPKLVWTIQGLVQSTLPFKDSGRVGICRQVVIDEEAVQALLLLSKTEGIIPAIESSPCYRRSSQTRTKTKKDEINIINVSGRGDKTWLLLQTTFEAK